MPQSYRDLIVWQKSVLLAREIYALTSQFPQSEIYGLTAQMNKCGVSIASNIAEGSRRSTRKDFRKFILTAYGSGAELETQIEIAKGLSFAKDISFVEVEQLLNEIMRMLNALHKTLTSKHTTHP